MLRKRVFLPLLLKRKQNSRTTLKTTLNGIVQNNVSLKLYKITLTALALVVVFLKATTSK